MSRARSLALHDPQIDRDAEVRFYFLVSHGARPLHQNKTIPDIQYIPLLFRPSIQSAFIRPIDKGVFRVSAAARTLRATAESLVSMMGAFPVVVYPSDSLLWFIQV